MRMYFKSTLCAKDIARAVILTFYILVVFGYFFLLYLRKINFNTTPSKVVNYFLRNYASFVTFMISWICFALFLFNPWRLFIQTLHCGDSTFETTVSRSVFAKKIILQALVVFISLGLYSPWALKNIRDLLIGQTSYKNKVLQFKSHALTLAIVYLPYTMLQFVMLGLQPNSTLAILILPITAFVTMYKHRWNINVSYDNKQFIAEFPLFSSTFFWLGQILLGIFTLGIYLPLACLRIYRYMLERTVIYEDNNAIGTLGFHNIDLGRAWFGLWLTWLLVGLTLGIYLPWALEKTVKLFINNSYLTENLACDCDET